MRDKAEIREAMRAERRSMPGERGIELSGRIVRRILAREEYRAAASVMCYVAMRGEVDLSELIARTRADGKALFLPRVEGGNLRAVRTYAGEPLILGRLGIREPLGDETAAPDQIDLILTPGVAFDRLGGRLGRGAGYYDRFFAGGAGFKIGVAFETQILDALPLEPFDVRMDGVLTECGWYRAGGER